MCAGLAGRLLLATFTPHLDRLNHVPAMLMAASSSTPSRPTTTWQQQEGLAGVQCEPCRLGGKYIDHEALWQAEGSIGQLLQCPVSGWLAMMMVMWVN